MGIAEIFARLFGDRKQGQEREEGHMNSSVLIHPAVDQGVKNGNPDFSGGVLTCKCASNPVKVTIGAQTRTITYAAAPNAGSPMAHFFHRLPWCPEIRST